MAIVKKNNLKKTNDKYYNNSFFKHLKEVRAHISNTIMNCLEVYLCSIKARSLYHIIIQLVYRYMRVRKNYCISSEISVRTYS